jgi:hypothetical protein
MKQKIAILGWGSLLWDDAANVEFNKHIEKPWHWKEDGPTLKLEFSRISTSRNGALTLVIDPNGSCCQVAYVFSNRKEPDEAICDLRCREGTTLENIGVYFLNDYRSCKDCHKKSLKNIKDWAFKKEIAVVIWTNLKSNFKCKLGKPFSCENAICYLQNLCPADKAKAAEYVWRTPRFVKTKLQEKLQLEPWFPIQS